MAAPGDMKGATIEATGASARLTTATTTTVTTPIEPDPRSSTGGVTPRAITRPELCALVVKLIREVAALRRELEVTNAELDVAVGELAVARGYRQMVTVAMAQLHEKNRERARERASYYRLLDDYRALRGQRRNVPPAA